ncbi:2-octaprenyl-6-methoxyphenyl hydroxylase [Aliiglaciecola sp. LCG003]|uniref:2-octaprenyl-6-methoxyphenyl hydroxylase n=1 Tax=Aliiglaciecola sp. LCG003 TaxID=3053655 RepID=UPI0025742AEE|nr:2-octaprenyl-6-methoxyphenyl hydroxylase [Aliiglaciecola sp. LCG003]WJG10229.1 2-octaprenyl-6-methoxyphenyl hydroxylase [Aliiglaciecola sp. LCG003]
MSQTTAKSVDILIAGGGATGLTLALAICRHTDLHVAIVEAGGPPTVSSSKGPEPLGNPPLELRSVALSAQSIALLGKLGLDTGKLGCPIEEIHVSDQGHFGQCRINAQDYQINALGQVVELTALVDKLRHALSAFKQQVSWYYNDEIVAIERSQKRVTATLKSTQTVVAKLLAIAEGGNSVSREIIGFDISAKCYQQSAIVANVELKCHHQYRAFERFTPSGPLALLPLQIEQQPHRHFCSLVWTLTQDEMPGILDLPDSEFIAALQEAFGYRLGEIIGVGPRSAFPLQLSHAQSHIHHRAALLGNASQTLHPIAGQGLNLALRDVQDLANRIIENPNNDIGSYSLLHDYQQSRRGDQKTLVGATDLLVRTFSNSYIPLVMGRNVALALLDNAPWLKQQFAMTAMGFRSQQGLRNAKL